MYWRPFNLNGEHHYKTICSSILRFLSDINEIGCVVIFLKQFSQEKLFGLEHLL